MVQSLSYDLDDLVDEMIDIYGSAAAADPALEVSWEDLRAGIHCAARLEGEDKWYRVVVDRVNSTTSIQVTLLDFGSLVIVPLSNLRWLLAQFYSLPSQAILAILSPHTIFHPYHTVIREFIGHTR